MKRARSNMNETHSCVAGRDGLVVGGHPVSVAAGVLEAEVGSVAVTSIAAHASIVRKAARAVGSCTKAC